jgi:hypothetical protein
MSFILWKTSTKTYSLTFINDSVLIKKKRKLRFFNSFKFLRDLIPASVIELLPVSNNRYYMQFKVFTTK